MKKKFFLVLAEYVLTFLLRLISLTCKKTYKGSLPDEPCVLLFWHDRLAFMPFIYPHLRQKDKQKKAHVIISEHSDGELITRVISHFGIGAVRGSTKRNAVAAFIGALRVLKDKSDLVITPDGPRGPRHSISDGCVSVPQRSRSKIVILHYKSSCSWSFKSWDKMELPKPFSRVSFTISEPFSVDGLEMNEAKALIAKEFEKCSL